MSYSQTKARNEAFPSVVDCAWKINALCKYLVRMWIYLHSINSASYRERRPIMTLSALGTVWCVLCVPLPHFPAHYSVLVFSWFFSISGFQLHHYFYCATSPSPVTRWLAHILMSFTPFLLWLLRGIFLVVFTAFEIHDAAFVDDRNFYNCTMFLFSFYSTILIYVNNISSQTKEFLSYSEHTDITVIYRL